MHIVNLKTVGPAAEGTIRFNVSRMGHPKGGEHLKALGNPYPAEIDNPGSTLPSYHKWLRTKLQQDISQRLALKQLCEAAEAGHDIELACWCEDPQRCHALVVASALAFHLARRQRTRTDATSLLDE